MPVKLCECGCGKPAPIAVKNCTATGAVKGQPHRFCMGHAPRTHGATGSPEYRAYKGAKQRCTDPKTCHWEDYGGRGIQFLFTSFEQFFAELGPKPTPQHSLDRIKVNGNYEPGNVKWSTEIEQQNNRRLPKPRRK